MLCILVVNSKSRFLLESSVSRGSFVLLTGLCVVSSASDGASPVGFPHASVFLIMKHLFSSGFLAREGITYGKLSHSREIVFGPALVVAYDLEKNIARYPRIIVSAQMIEIFKYRGIDDDIYLDFDGYYCCDYLYDMVDDAWLYDVERPGKGAYYIRKIKEKISEGYNEASFNTINKYEYMKYYFNKSVDKLNRGGSLSELIFKDIKSEQFENLV